MARLAQMDEYDSRFGRRLVDEDFLAAGFTPEEVQQYRGAISQPSLTPEDRAAMEARYGLLQAPDYTMRQTAANRAQDKMISEGMDPYVAGLYSRRIFGDTAPTDGGLGIGLADFTPLGIPFGIQEGSRTAAQGYQQGDPLQMGLGALEAGMGLLEATPLTAAIGRGISNVASRMDPNTLYSLLGPPRGPSSAGETTGIRAYHGSPHDFDRFSMDAIGTGEGAQAYGHGLYFAENEGVARGYRDALSGNRMDSAVFTLDDGLTLDPSTSSILRKNNGDIDAAILELRNRAESSPISGLRAQASERADFLEANRSRISFNPAGRMYEVNINANPEDFLDWDRPFASPDDLERFAARFDATDPMLRKRIEDFGYVRQQMGQPMPDGNDIIREIMGGIGSADAARASAVMNEAGIPGVRYFDAGSRGAGEGSRNYVVFDENLIEIVRKYGIAGAAALLGVAALDVEQAMAQGSQQQPQGLLSGLQ